MQGLPSENFWGIWEGLGTPASGPPRSLPASSSEAAEQVRGSAPLQSEMLDVVRQELDDDAIVVAGVTDMGYWAHLAFPVHQTRSYLTSSYFATLGFALPTAIGAKIGNPYRQVVALCGDGGFTYASNELATAAQEGANVVALLFNNGALGASLTEQRDRLQGRYIGTALPPVDYQGLAQSLGAKGMKLSAPQELRDALRTPCGRTAQWWSRCPYPCTIRPSKCLLPRHELSRHHAPPHRRTLGAGGLACS